MNYLSELKPYFDKSEIVNEFTISEDDENYPIFIVAYGAVSPVILFKGLIYNITNNAERQLRLFNVEKTGVSSPLNLRYFVDRTQELSHLYPKEIQDKMVHPDELPF